MFQAPVLCFEHRNTVRAQASVFQARVLCTYKSAVVTVTLLPAVCAAMMAFHFSAWHVTEDGACDIHPRIRYFMVSQRSPVRSLKPATDPFLRRAALPGSHLGPTVGPQLSLKNNA